jgi:4-phytase/acid phosphatase
VEFANDAVGIPVFSKKKPRENRKSRRYVIVANDLFSRPNTLPLLLFASLLAVPVGAQTVSDIDDGTILKQIIIFGRHGVRSPTVSPADYAKVSPRPYPDFGVPPGYLTTHGWQAESLLGAYFREYLLHERVFTGDVNWDALRSYFRANSIQRSNVTAAAFGAGLFEGMAVPVHSYPLGQTDSAFDPISTNVAAVDAVRAAGEVRQVYNSGAALASAYSGELSLIRSVLFDYQTGVEPLPAAPAGITDATALPIPLEAFQTGLATGHVVDMGGILATMVSADPFVMEYATGLPLADVGWGHLSLNQLSQQTRLITLAFNVAFTTPYLNQVQSSNAGSHVLRSMEQAVIQDGVPGSFGSPGSRVNVIISSDAYVIGLAGLLGLHWQLPGYQPDFCAPGGALVFELRQSSTSGEHLVRVFYTAQTWEQLRDLTPLGLQTPPATAQLLIPGGREPGAGLDVRFARFQSLLKKAIGAQFVEDPAREVPPGVLTGVPLK